MKRLLMILAAWALVCASPARADSPATLSEGFDNVSALSGWSMANYSTPAPGSGWFQGNPGVFPALSGAPGSYIAANYMAASPGGDVDLWLITPVVNVSSLTQILYSLRSAGDPGYSDTVQLLFGPGSGTDPAGFTLINHHAALGASWQSFAAGSAIGGEGRFAFRFMGAADSVNYIGLDSVMITQVPEPATYVMLCIGLVALLGFRRGRAMVSCGAIAVSSAAFAGEPPPSGMVVVRDPQTGQLRAPTETEFKALTELSSSLQAGVPAAPAQTVVRPDGALQRSIGAEGMSYSVVSRGRDGKLKIECVTGAQAARPATGAKENGHETE